MQIRFPFALCVLCAGLCSAQVVAAKIKSRGEIATVLRAFNPDDDARTDDFDFALTTLLDVKAKQGPFRQAFRAFARTALVEEERSIAFVQDAWIGYRDSRLELKAGVEILNWTAAEAFHPADIINSRNLDSNIENAEKLGEPLVSARLRFGTGGLTLYYLPARFAPVLPGPQSRLNLAQGQAVGSVKWLNRDGSVSESPFEHQWASRLDQTFGALDIAVHYVDHNDRNQPALVLNLADQGIRPVFGRVRRLGTTATASIGDWLFKVEADHRAFRSWDIPMGQLALRQLPQNHTAAAVGLEWGWAYESDAEATLLVEGQAMIAPDLTTEEIQQLDPFQRDILVGYRHVYNDTASTEWTLGLIADTHRWGEFIANATYSRRLADEWGLKCSLRSVRAPHTSSLLNVYDNQHSVQLGISRFF